MVELLNKLLALGVKLGVDDGKLTVSAPKGVLNSQLQAEIKENKDALLQSLLAEEQNKAKRDVQQIVPDAQAQYQPFPLNSVQHAYWIGRNQHIQLGGVSTHFYFELECERLSIESLNRSLNAVVQRHAMLRAVIAEDGSQRILEETPDYDIQHVDLTDLNDQEKHQRLVEARDQMSAQVLPCATWPLFEIRAFTVTENQTRMLISWDFLVVDAWSMILIFQEWNRFYRDPELSLPNLELTFRDYVLAEERQRQGVSYKASKRYWMDRVDTLPLGPTLPVRGDLSALGVPQFTRRRKQLDADKWDLLKRKASQYGLTPSGILLGVFAEVISRWSKEHAYSLNVTLFNRQNFHPQVNDIVGDFTSLMALEVDPPEQATFVKRALSLQRQFLSDFEHREFSAVDVLREVAKRRQLSNQALMPVVFTSTLMLDSNEGYDGAGLEQFGDMTFGITQTPQVLLDCQIFEVSQALVYNWDAVEDAFEHDVLDHMIEAHQSLLELLVSEDQVWTEENVVYLPAEQQKKREAYNLTSADVVDELLHDGFLRSVSEHPSATAVYAPDRQLSYSDLHVLSIKLANSLIAAGVKPSEPIAVHIDKGWQQVVAVVGILLAGCAYLPVGTNLPVKRKEHLLDQADVNVVVVAQEDSATFVANGSRAVVVLDQDTDGAAEFVGQPDVSTDSLAYIIFTSGSTGTPKGVAISHRAAVNTVAYINKLYRIEQTDSVLAVSSLSFDLSVYDIFGLLAVGGKVVMPAAPLEKDPGHWRELITSQNVTVWNSAPPLMGVLIDYIDHTAEALSHLRVVMLSGDWIPVKLPDRIRRYVPDSQIYSLGGATEGSIWSIHYPISEVSAHLTSIPYGVPLPNQHMYVLDRHYLPCPDYVPGDIYIGGDGVAMGYYNSDELTRNSFVLHPKTQERIYRTGDMGRFHHDNYIEFLGREDSQIKWRGHRVELTEISSVIQSHPEIQQSVVKIGRDSSHDVMAAYVVVDSDEHSQLATVTDAGTQSQPIVRQEILKCAQHAIASPDSDSLEAFARFWSDLQSVSETAICATLFDLGVRQLDVPWSQIEALLNTMGMGEHQQRLVSRWLEHIGGNPNSLGSTPEAISAVTRQTKASLDSQLLDMRQRYQSNTQFGGFFEYVDSCLRHQVALLKEDISPLELLFPNESWSLAESIYQTNPIAKHHNTLIAASVQSIVEHRDTSKPVRILEIGAGTGSATSEILPRLSADTVEYVYTDVTPFFLAGAKNKFSNYPFVSYSIYDINQDPISQGLEPHSFDIIVAINVLHDLVNVDTGLTRLRKLLGAGGYLLALEGTENSTWQWVTVGHLEESSGFTDERQETGLPVLDERSWKNALVRNGFSEALAFPGDDNEEVHSHLIKSMQQHVLVGFAPTRTVEFNEVPLREFVSDYLPDYMLPQKYIALDAMPLTSNGKIDYAALPALNVQRASSSRQMVTPETDLEATIKTLWEEVLGTDDVSVTDNFFEVGGDSLLLTNVLARLKKSFSQEISIADLFANPTVRSLAEHLAPRSSVDVNSADQTAAVRRTSDNDDIAIIGMAGRFPGAHNVDEFWDNLEAGHCAVHHYSTDELRNAGVPEEVYQHERYVPAGVVLDGIEEFDAERFGMTPREAQIMDPQQRMLLEVALETLEYAGYARPDPSLRVGVVVGKSASQYLLQHLLFKPDLANTVGRLAIVNANGRDYAATHISHKLNLTGPSLSVNTACSTSLVAVHQACQMLLGDECEIVLAGGASVVDTLQKAGYFYQTGHILSRDGFCRAFSKDADGCVFGSGVGMVALKRLSRAIEDGDTVHAVIKGSAINNDGAEKVGYSAPNVKGQSSVIRQALANAGVDASSIGYVEAHGTATRIGDVIELEALKSVFSGVNEQNTCGLGSVKSNVGHLDSAAGVTSLIKSVEVLKRGRIPQSLHCPTTNPVLGIEESPFFVPTQTENWRKETGPRRAGVSSFGVGGTNAHVVLEQAPNLAPVVKTARCASLIPVSVAGESVRKRTLDKLRAHLEDHPQLDINDVAFTLQEGRAELADRCAFTASSTQQLIDKLRVENPVWNRVDGTSTISVAFMLPGQGVPLVNQGRALYENYAVYKDAIEECTQILDLYLSGSFIELIYPSELASGDAPTAEQMAALSSTDWVQPALFVIEYASVKLWMSLGVQPDYLIGHSLGEIVAACIAGVFSLEDALSLVCVRGQLMQSMPAGNMIAAATTEQAIVPLIEQSGCDLAAVNCEDQCVAAGESEAIDRLTALLKEQQIQHRPLNTSHAFHSQMMDPILETFEECVRQVNLSRPTIPIISNVTGQQMTDAQAQDPAYWGQHLRNTVRFAAGKNVFATRSNCLAIDMGPGNVLSSFIRADCGRRLHVVETMPKDLAAQANVDFWIDAVGSAWRVGVECSFADLRVDGDYQRVVLPAYAFERKRHWVARGKAGDPVAMTILDASIDGSVEESVTMASTIDEEFAEEVERVPSETDELHARPSLSTSFAEPNNDTERNVISIWQSLLGIGGIGIDDNYFELGGDSLLATRLHTRLQAEFEVEIPFAKLIALDTVRRMALFIAVSKDEGLIDQLDEHELDDFLSIMEA